MRVLAALCISICAAFAVMHNLTASTHCLCSPPVITVGLITTGVQPLPAALQNCVALLRGGVLVSPLS